jgi:hypothetical protein
MRRIGVGIAGVTLGLFVLVAIAAGTDEKIALDKLPKAVVDAVKAKYPKAKLVSAEKGDQDGKIVYEVDIKDGKSSIEVTVTPEGKILGAEKEIAAEDLPQPVSKALNAKYPKATIKKIEEVSKEDKITAYEILIVTAHSKMLEVTFDPTGKFIEEEKVGAKKKAEKKEEKKGNK